MNKEILELRLALAQKIAESGFWQQKAGEIEVEFLRAMARLEELEQAQHKASNSDP